MANTASRLSANGSLTISGSFDEVTGTYVSNGLIGSWDVNKSYYPEIDASTWYDMAGNNNIKIYNNNGTPALFSPSSNSANITFYTTNGSSVALGSYGVVAIPQLATTANVTLEGVFNINQIVGMLGGFATYDIYMAGGALGFNTASSDVYGISAATVTSLNLRNRNVHYVFVFPTSNLPGAYQLWINGVQQSLSLVVGSSTPSTRFYNNRGDYAFQLNGWYAGTPTNGAIPPSGTYYGNASWSSFRMYNRVLTPAEIQQNYNIASARYQLGSTVKPVVTATRSNNTTQTITQVISDEFDEVTYNPNNIGPTKNLFQNSQDFNQQFDWIIANGTVTKNSALAPDNTQTASLFSASGQYPVIYYITPATFGGYKFGEPGKFYTHSIFVKYVNQSRCTLATESWPIDGSLQFDLLTGSLASSLNGPITRATITPFPNGWWRISVTYLIPSRSDAADPNEFFWNPQWRLGNYDNTNYSGSQMLVWGAQLEEGNTASTYVATGFPKNILLFTDELTTTSTYYWYRENCTITKNAIISPDGNYNGFLLSSTINGGSNTGFFQRFLSNLPINTNYTYSVYLKQGTSPTTFLNFYNVSPFSQLIATITWPAIYGNAPTVSYSGDATRLASTITDAGNGWWRFSLSMNNGSSSGLVWRVYTTTNGVTNVIGNNVYVWGPQLEFGLAPTTLIRNAGNFINTLPLANTNMVMKTTNTGNTFIKDTFDEVTGNISNTDNLIGYYDAAKTLSYSGTGSTWFDLSSSRNHATLNSSPTFSTDTVGYNYFNFDGINNTGNIPNVNLQQNFTLECWVKHQRVNGFAFFGHGTTSNNQGLHIWFNNPDSIRIGMYANDTDFYGLSTNVNQWYHYVFTYQNSAPWTKQAFRNGVALTPTVVYTAAQYLGSGPLRIGAIFGFGTTLGYGQFGHVKIYNKVLSQTEVTQNFNELRGRYGI